MYDYIEDKESVNQFLTDLKNILTDKKFNINTDLDILLRKSGEKFNDPYTTQNTLLELGYDKEDIKTELLSLRIGNYANTLIDKGDTNVPPFYVFYKEIQGRQVYVKIKIRNKNNLKIFCISFHFAKYVYDKFPY